MRYSDEAVEQYKLNKVCSVCGNKADSFLPLQGNRKAFEVCCACAIDILPCVVGEAIMFGGGVSSGNEGQERTMVIGGKVSFDVNFWRGVALVALDLCKMVPSGVVGKKEVVKRRPGRPRKKKAAEELPKEGGSVVPFQKTTPETSSRVNQKADPEETVAETRISDSVVRRRNLGEGSTE